MAHISVQISRVPEGRGDPLPLPAYETPGSAGMDLRADIEQTIVLEPLGRYRVPTGIAVAIPPGYEAQIRPRSGLAAKKGITCLNTPGTIDSDYRGEVQVLLVNLSNQPFAIERGDRVAQMVVSPVVRASLLEVESLPDTARGAGGFGHTGKR